MNQDHWDEFKNEAVSDEYLRGIVANQDNNLVDEPCPACNGRGIVLQRDENGDPLTVRCLSCGYGVSQEKHGLIMLAWANGSDFNMKRGEETYDLATVFNLNRIACALENLVVALVGNMADNACDTDED